MRSSAHLLSVLAAVTTLAVGLLIVPSNTDAAGHAKSMSNIEQGKKLTFNRKKGNCLACHQIKGGNLAGNVGPALVSMKARFPDKAVLRAQIFDATKKNPNTMMPPFGRHKILSGAEIDKVVEFVYSL